MSLVKKGAETQKLKAETRKINLEADALAQNYEQETKVMEAKSLELEQRIHRYKKLLSSEGVSLSEASYSQIWCTSLFKRRPVSGCFPV